MSKRDVRFLMAGAVMTAGFICIFNGIWSGMLLVVIGVFYLPEWQDGV